MPHESGLTCDHCTDGLCPACEADYDIDPTAWVEFGPHPAGNANVAALDAEMEAHRPSPEAMLIDWDDVPY